jgi:hypothetical protein
MATEDIRHLLSLMPRAVDFIVEARLRAGSVRRSRGNPSRAAPTFALPLDDMEAARAFLRDHGRGVACYRLDPREEGKLMLGMFNDGEAKTIAREELSMEVPEGVFGQSA